LLRASGQSARSGSGPATLVIEAIDYQTGKIRWSHELGPESGAGVLTTDSGQTFTGDGHGNFLALDSSAGKTLWHAGSGGRIVSSPISYELNGRQYVVTSSSCFLFAWAPLQAK
jgi:alcohol dehydrogenase (cytochrome c)